MRKSLAFFFMLALLLSSLSLVASEVDSTMVGEDLLIAGDNININEPVNGDVLALGGNIYVNAPIYGDLIAFGGVIEVNENIEGKIIVAGGTVVIRADVYKVLAAAGKVDIHTSSKIKTNAYIASPTVENYGEVTGEMRVISSDFENNGVIGNLELYEMQDLEGLDGLSSFIRFIIRVISILVTIGFMILGLILLRIFKKQFLAVEQEIRSSPVIATVLGFVLFLGSLILTVLLTITLVGIPFAILLGALTVMALLLAHLFVSLAIGRKLGETIKWETSDYWYFIVGFIIVRVLTWLPFIDLFFIVLFTSVGFGAIFYAVKNNWSKMVDMG